MLWRSKLARLQVRSFLERIHGNQVLNEWLKSPKLKRKASLHHLVGYPSRPDSPRRVHKREMRSQGGNLQMDRNTCDSAGRKWKWHAHDVLALLS